MTTKFKFKKLITQITLISFIGQTLILSGCVGNTPANSKQVITDFGTKAQKQLLSTKHITRAQASEPNGVWANIVGADDKPRASKLGLLADNSSDYTLRLVGCESVSYAEPHLADIVLSQTGASVTTNYDPKWQPFDIGGGIYAPESVMKDKKFSNSEAGLLSKVITDYNKHEEARLLELTSKEAINDMDVTHEMIVGFKQNGMKSIQTKIQGSFVAGVVCLVLLVSIGTLKLASRNSNNAKGQENTSVTTVNLSVPNNEDVVKWNRTHAEDDQIEANTKMVPITNGTENAMNNTLAQIQMYNFIDPEVDPNVGIKASVEVETAPLMRPDQSEQDDPLLGKLDNKNKASDAVLMFSIYNLTEASPFADMDYQMTLDVFHEEGLDSLAEDDRFDAPMYKVQQVLDRKTNTVVYNSSSSNISNSNLKDEFGGIAISQGQEVTLDVSLPTTGIVTKLAGGASVKGNAAPEIYGQGFGVDYFSEEESGELSYMNIKSSTLRESFEQESYVQPFLYSKFDGAYPLRVGDHALLHLSIGGMDDGKKHEGKLYLADGNSKTTAIPFYTNYQLKAEPNSGIVTEGDGSITVVIKNLGKADGFSSLKVSGLPPEATLVEASPINCDKSPLKYNQVCTLTYDVSRVASGTSPMIFYGASKDNNSNTEVSADDANASAYTLTVEGGF